MPEGNAAAEYYQLCSAHPSPVYYDKDSKISCVCICFWTTFVLPRPFLYSFCICVLLLSALYLLLKGVECLFILTTIPLFSLLIVLLMHVPPACLRVAGDPLDQKKRYNLEWPNESKRYDLCLAEKFKFQQAARRHNWTEGWKLSRSVNMPTSFDSQVSYQQHDYWSTD